MKRIGIILLTGIFLMGGLTVMLYPVISRQLSEWNQSKVIREYAASVQAADQAERSREKELAREYNRILYCQMSGVSEVSDAEGVIGLRERYESVLNPGGDGIMSYIVIPKIQVSLPVYHGTDDRILKMGAGHLMNTSFPVGGDSTHTVISAHTGYPGSVLFDHLTQLEIGDRFCLYTLEERMYYEVEEILITDPYDFTELMIQENRDLCTLVTCYPYGINTHRLLVRGVRTEEDEQKPAGETQKGYREQIEGLPYLAAGIALLMLLLAAAGLLRRRKREGERMKWRRKYR